MINFTPKDMEELEKSAVVNQAKWQVQQTQQEITMQDEFVQDQMKRLEQLSSYTGESTAGDALSLGVSQGLTSTGKAAFGFLHNIVDRISAEDDEMVDIINVAPEFLGENTLFEKYPVATLARELEEKTNQKALIESMLVSRLSGWHAGLYTAANLAASMVDPTNIALMAAGGGVVKAVQWASLATKTAKKIRDLKRLQKAGAITEAYLKPTATYMVKGKPVVMEGVERFKTFNDYLAHLKNVETFKGAIKEGLKKSPKNFAEEIGQEALIESVHYLEALTGGQDLPEFTDVLLETLGGAAGEYVGFGVLLPSTKFGLRKLLGRSKVYGLDTNELITLETKFNFDKSRLEGFNSFNGELSKVNAEHPDVVELMKKIPNLTSAEAMDAVRASMVQSKYKELDDLYDTIREQSIKNQTPEEIIDEVAAEDVKAPDFLDDPAKKEIEETPAPVLTKAAKEDAPASVKRIQDAQTKEEVIQILKDSQYNELADEIAFKEEIERNLQKEVIESYQMTPEEIEKKEAIDKFIEKDEENDNQYEFQKRLDNEEKRDQGIRGLGIAEIDPDQNGLLKTNNMELYIPVTEDSEVAPVSYAKTHLNGTLYYVINPDRYAGKLDPNGSRVQKVRFKDLKLLMTGYRFLKDTNETFPTHLQYFTDDFKKRDRSDRHKAASGKRDDVLNMLEIAENSENTMYPTGYNFKTGKKEKTRYTLKDRITNDIKKFHDGIIHTLTKEEASKIEGFPVDHYFDGEGDIIYENFDHNLVKGIEIFEDSVKKKASDVLEDNPYVPDGDALRQKAQMIANEKTSVTPEQILEQEPEFNEKDELAKRDALMEKIFATAEQKADSDAQAEGEETSARFNSLQEIIEMQMKMDMEIDPVFKSFVDSGMTIDQFVETHRNAMLDWFNCRILT